MAITYKFSGHESFPCKTLWLKKGYDFVRNENDFNSPNAVISLGVGKNMVSSIRYWLKAFGITDATGNLTEIGNYLFDEENGRDKYLEDLATLWLLHFNIVFLQEVTLYRWFFCGLQRERAQFQNYTLPRKAQSNEDYSSLLLDLDLIRQKSETKGYYFNVDGKRKVTKEVFMYGLLKLKEKNKDNTIAYETIHDQLGLLFCMNDTETITMLKSLSHIYSKQMTYSDVSGIRQVQFIDELNPTTVLEDYYAHI